MRKSILLSAFICLLVATTVSAHDTPAQYNRISFSVSAEADIANDELVIIMTALEQGRDLENLADKVNKTMDWALKEAVKKDSVKAQTLNYQTQPRYEKGKQTGWQVTQSLSLKSTSSEDLSELMGKLQSQLQVQSASHQVTAAKQQQLEDELTTQALQRFSDKAEQVTQALQAKSYKIVQINLNAGSPGYPRPMVGMARNMMAAESVTPPSFEPGTQTVSITASGTIEMTE